VTHGLGQFRVETPVGAVTALGTEFSVRLRPAGRDKGNLWMAVNVTDGSVQVDAGNKSFKLSVGDRRVFGDDGEQNNVDDGDQNNQNDGDQGSSARGARTANQ
jgi:ferric-dicitrate binding protein FerR (iron transport regulator)